MQQLLPEVKNVLETLVNGGKRPTTIKPISEDWKHFVAFLKKVDEIADTEKDKIVAKVPFCLRALIKDAFHLKKNNDRTVAGYLGVLCTGACPGRFIDALVALDVQDFSVTLIDDIIDNEERRANKVACHIKLGTNTTLTIAMFLKSLSSQIVLESKLKNNVKLRILSEMENLHSKIYEGQFLDVQYEGKAMSEISESDYLKMVSLTTGYQFAGFLRIGGILAGASASNISLLGKIGLRLGTLGQIRDDLVDYLPDEKQIWKTPLLDFKRNKRRLPLIIGWNSATPAEKRKIIELQKKKRLNVKDHATIVGILMKSENLEQIRVIMRKLKDEGHELIDQSDFKPKGKKLLRAYFSYGMAGI
jgi:geranylgeranyl pyrophosphate synthase